MTHSGKILEVDYEFQMPLDILKMAHDIKTTNWEILLGETVEHSSLQILKRELAVYCLFLFSLFLFIGF